MRIVLAGMLTVLAILSSGCATTGGGSFCQIAQPILISDGDSLTEETARDILAHNLTGRELCDW